MRKIFKISHLKNKITFNKNFKIKIWNELKNSKCPFHYPSQILSNNNFQVRFSSSKDDSNESNEDKKQKKIKKDQEEDGEMNENNTAPNKGENDSKSPSNKEESDAKSSPNKGENDGKPIPNKETERKKPRYYQNKSNEEDKSVNMLAIKGLKYQAKQPTPDTVPVFPLYERPLFPGTLTSCYVEDKGLLESLSERVSKGERYVGLFLVKESEKKDNKMPNITNFDQIHQFGTLGLIVDMSGTPHSPFVQIVISGARRIKITGQVDNEPRLTARIEEIKEKAYDKNDPVIKAHTQEILRNIKELSNLDLFYKEQIHALAEHIDFTNPAELSDLICAISSNKECNSLFNTILYPF